MATQTSEAPKVTTLKPDKSKRRRSPNYPAESLETAAGRVKKLYDKDHEAGSTIPAALAHIGFPKPHGEAYSILAGLKRFGLVDEISGRIVVTKRAVDILLFPEVDRGKRAKREAALLPHMYKVLVERFKITGLPSDESLAPELIADYGFNANAVSKFLRDFRASLAYSGISLGVGVSSNAEGHADDPTLSADEEIALKPEGEIKEPERAGSEATKVLKTKIFNVALDSLATDNPQFAQVLVPIPLSETQKKRLKDFVDSL